MQIFKLTCLKIFIKIVPESYKKPEMFSVHFCVHLCQKQTWGVVIGVIFYCKALTDCEQLEVNNTFSLFNFNALIKIETELLLIYNSNIRYQVIIIWHNIFAKKKKN